MSRLLILLFGALPATVLGTLAIGITAGGLRSLASAEISGFLIFAWGLLGVVGVAGLWLAVLVGLGSPVASRLIACGLAADTVLFFLILRNAAAAPPVAISGRDAAAFSLLTLPFLVGVAYICHALRRDHRADAHRHGAV